jgi:hypothetical protein
MEMAEKFQTKVYRLNEVTFLPHYRNHNIYVGPGYPIHKQRYSEADLLTMGATPDIMMLWSRGVSGSVSDSNP